MTKKQIFYHSFDMPPPLSPPPQPALDEAIRLHQQGLLPQAEQLYRQFLHSQPEHSQALNLLGVLVAQSRQDHGEAEQLITRAIGIDPGVAEYHNNLGLTFQQQGKYKEAAASFRRAINLKGDFAMAWFGLGNVSARLKDAPTAIKSYQKVIAIRPGFFQALNNLGNVYREIGDYEKARQCLDQALALKPDFAAGWYSLGLLYKVMQDGGNAVEAFSRAIELNQAYVQAYLQRSLCYCRLLNDIDSALRDCDRMLEINPGSVGARLVKATAYQEAGRFDEAESELRKVLELDASSLEAYLGLVITRKYNDQDMAKIKDLLEDGDVHEQQVSSMHFSMARILDERGDYEQAFRHLLQGNALHRKTYEFDVKDVEQGVTMLIDTFTADSLREKPGQGLDTEVPVFIVGMPRSGTTLTEQIIASHPEAFGAGELVLISRIAGELSYKGFGKYPECIFKLPPTELTQQAERYLDGIRKLNGTARRITDKMTHNFLHVGLISLMFPRAVIIHCRRHPLDTCLSIFERHFESHHPYAYDLAELGLYYKQYLRLMGHWEAVLPEGRLLTVRYEDLVADMEGMSRKLIERLGLPWDDRCLEFYRTERTVKTSSTWQVRQNVYSSSVDRWRRYEPWLGPLMDALGDAVKTVTSNK